MNRVISCLISSVLLLSTSPVFAQQGANPDYRGPGWGYGHMWDGGGWHPGMFFGGVMMLIIAVAVILLIVWLVRVLTHHSNAGPGYHGGGRSGAHDILAERFARGEIDKTEFEDKKRAIGR